MFFSWYSSSGAELFIWRECGTDMLEFKKKSLGGKKWNYKDALKSVFPARKTLFKELVKKVASQMTNGMVELASSRLISLWHWACPVSYTHLTLPTIRA